MQDKKKILIGIIFLFIALVSTLGAFYLMVDAQQQAAEHIDILKERIVILNEERNMATQKTEQLEGEVGESIYLRGLIEEARIIYGDKEEGRKDGRLWIDRATESIVVTLGALNGLNPGDHLVVYDDKDRIAVITVEIPMDVISYIKPHRKLLDQYETDYFRVVIEE